jgi:hypothetical protein
MSEGSLLCVVEILLKPKFPEFKPTEILPFVTKISRSAIDMAKADKGHIGGLAWTKLEKFLDNPIYHKWLDVQ